MSQAPQLSPEDAATVRALLDGGIELEGALRGCDIATKDWELAEESLLAELADEVDRGERARMDAYQAAYRKALAAAPSKSNQPKAQADAATSAPTASAVAAPPAGAFDPDATAQADNRAILVALANRGVPFAKAGPPMPAPPVVSAGGDDQSGETAELDMRAIRASLAEKPLPFAGAGSAPPRSAPAPASGADVDATGILDNSKVLEGLRNRGVPFESKVPTTSSDEIERLLRQPAPPPTASTSTGTEEHDMSAFRAGAPLPFEGGDEEPQAPEPASNSSTKRR